MNENLHEVAKALVAPGKGILASDESTGSLEKQFAANNIPFTHENRMAWRTLLYSTPGIEEYISGAIQFEETLQDQLLKSEAIIPIIKVDVGFENNIIKPMPGLAERLTQYKALGAKAAKARALLAIPLTTDENIRENARREADYARICQEAGIVPMVEPEVLMDGPHSMQECEDVTRKILRAVFEELAVMNVDLAGIILKPNMILPGTESGEKATHEEVARATVAVLKNCVPTEVAGIAFLSGGQSDEDATMNLNEINKIGGPWPMTFSYGRGLQRTPQKIWGGKPENVAAAQQEFLKLAKMNSLASKGELLV